MSPHSYCFTVELLEPLRYLSCTKYALELYNTLGVRYIQVLLLLTILTLFLYFIFFSIKINYYFYYLVGFNVIFNSSIIN